MGRMSIEQILGGDTMRQYRSGRVGPGRTGRLRALDAPLPPPVGTGTRRRNPPIAPGPGTISSRLSRKVVGSERALQRAKDKQARRRATTTRTTASRPTPRTYRMARIMVHPGGPGKLPTYAGATYFYTLSDYQRYVKPLIASGKIPSSGVITPDKLQRLVGRPFSSRYAKQYLL